jgi:phenylalanyl-tRNA synthetase beta chain
MRISESWLRSFVNPPIASSELAHRLTMSGAEVEEQTSAAPAFSGVVVAKVLEVAKHPGADKLSVCQVDAGTGTILNIVCGARNVRPGIKVPCAIVGAKLPGDGVTPFEIKLAKMRGVESQGMLCSATELGLPEDVDGLFILRDDLPVGQDFRKALDLDDQVFTLKLTPNKADCLSVYGIAREVAAITGAALCKPAFKAVPVSIQDKLAVKIEAPDLCGRFSGRVIRSVNCKAPTPHWMKERLARAGQRSISALVDISNYIMLELGRPSHIFDLDKIHGGLTVRWGKKGETLKLLNGNTVELDEKVGVIADNKHVESLAGIMGGDSTAVNDDTRNIYVEAAFWWPEAIRGRARRYNFSTDAGHRFERGVDATTTTDHIEYISQLILDICGGQAGPMDDQITKIPERKPVTMRVARCCKVIGAQIAASEMAAIFTRLQFTFTQTADAFVVTPPAWRFDIEIEEDLIEEVARIWGFDNLPKRAPLAQAVLAAVPEGHVSAHTLRRKMAALGYAEALNYSFVDATWETDYAANAAPIKLLNPIASHLSVMRSTLLGSLAANIASNLRHRESRVRMFEVGRVFKADPKVLDGDLEVAGVHQPMMLGAIAYGPAQEEQWGVAKPARQIDFFDVKGDLEQLAAHVPLEFVAAEHPALHPGRCAQIQSNGKIVGVIGELHPRLVQKNELPHAPVLFEIELAALAKRSVPVHTPIARTPVVIRDLAVIVPETVQMAQITAALQMAIRQRESQNLVQLWRLFDVHRGGMAAGEKSLAMRFWLQDTEGTLNDETVERVMQHLLRTLETVGARLRS